MPNLNTSDLAREFLRSFDHAEPVAATPSAVDPAFDLDSAYAVEAEFRRLRGQAGHQPVGRKVGFANKAMWRVLKLETLVWDSMYDDTVHDGASALSLAGCISPRIEPEIVFRLKEPTESGGLDAVEWMALGFEIIDCPFPGWQFKPVDFVAAFGLHRALVVGEHCPVDAGTIPHLTETLASFKLRLLKNGELVEEGSGRNSLRSPALCLAELATAVLRRTGAPLAAGEYISTGTLTNPQPVAAGETWQAEADGLPVAGLTVTFK